MILPTPEEQAQRDAMMRLILEHVREDRTIKLPAFDPCASRPSDRFALLSIGIEQNQFGGSIGHYRYQFEGEEDLLHLIVMRHDAAPLTPAEGQMVASFVLKGLPTALIWLRPGEYSQHFYFGHDELLDNLTIE